MAKPRRISLNTKLNLLIISVILTTVVVLTIQMVRSEFSQTYDELTKDGRTVAEMAAKNAEYAVYTEDESALVILIDALSVDPDIVEAAVLDREKNPLVSKIFRAEKEAAPGAIEPAAGPDRGTQILHTDSVKNGRIIIVAPVLSRSLAFDDDFFYVDQPSEQEEEETIGYVSLTMDTAGAKLRVRSYISRVVLFTTFLLLFGVSLTVLVTRRIVSPLRRLSEAVGEIAAGQFDQETDIGTPDEIGDLGRSFNEMARNLRDYRNKVGERTSALEESNRMMEHEMAERRKLETQLLHAQKMEAVGHFAGGVAHDFNNILMAIKSFASLLKMDIEEGSTVRHYVDEISSSADRASQLTKNLLTFSRKQSIHPEPVDLNDIVTHLRPMLSRLIGEHIDQQFQLWNGKLSIMADRNQIEQVLMNLATNARDAMPEGGTFTLETEKKEFDKEFVGLHGFGRPGTYALISISDSGEGLDPEIREKIFEPFFTTKDVDKGTGLGLSILYGIVKQHKGYVDVYSEKERGTRFAVYLPFVEGDVRKEGVEKEDVGAVRGTETILLAEDEEKLRSAIGTILTRHGYRVIEARDGEEAVAKYRELGEGIDLMLSDVMMPRKNGKVAYEEIVAEGGSLKTIFMSGYSEKVLPGGIDLGEGVSMLSKPVNPRDLLRKIREAFDGLPATRSGPSAGSEGGRSER
jgi:signal transduction histidine kinase/ActR/RegA family two-component response regulator